MDSVFLPQSISAISYTPRLCKVRICLLIILCLEDIYILFPPSVFPVIYLLLSLVIASPSVSSEVSGPGLPSCQRHRLHSDQRAQGPAEAVQASRRATGLFQIAGMTIFYFGPEFRSYNNPTK